MNPVEAFNGASALLEGFGKEPPSQEVAQARSDVCTGRLTGHPCKANYLGGWAISSEIARVIHAQRQKKLQLHLEVQGESTLGTCKVCRCPLALKVWYDAETIRSHTTDDKFDQLKETNPQCWIAALKP